MARLGFYFSQEECIGCKACQVACNDRNGLPAGKPFRRVLHFETGVYPDAKLFHHSMACNHCENPACVANCPTLAMHKSDDGTVIHDDELCIGCGSCVMACPYNVPVLYEETGMANKCDSCKPFRDAGQNPVCVDACPMRCLDFGDLDELKAKYGDNLVNELPYMPSASITNPSLLIAPKPYVPEATDANQILL